MKTSPQEPGLQEDMEGSPQDSPLITIREAQVQDVEAIVSIGRRSFALSFKGTVPDEDVKRSAERCFTKEDINFGLGDKQKNTLVALDEKDTIRGFAKFVRDVSAPFDSTDGEDIYVALDNVYVEPGFCGKGIGARLVKTAVDIARKDEYDTMWLVV